MIVNRHSHIAEKSVLKLVVPTLLLLLIPGASSAQTTRMAQTSSPPSQAPRTLSLSVAQAVDIALAPEGNARVQIAEKVIRQAEAQSAQARAGLLPHVDASVGQQNRTINLDAMGIRIDVPVPGFTRPTLVGPFDTFDARATLSQSILDLSSIRRYQASRAGIRAAEAVREDVEDHIIADVARAYLVALRAEANLTTARANVELAEELGRLAEHQKEVGTGTGIEVTRAQVQLAHEQQQLLVAENERRDAHLRLLRVMGLDLDVEVQLADHMDDTPEPASTVEQALVVALQSRADYRAQQQQVENTRLGYSAARMERLPSIVGFADYGTIGSSINNTLPTRTFGFSVRLPVFDGGRLDARRAESRSRLEQEQIRLGDLRDQIELEIRLALNALESAQEQVRVAEQGLTLAEQELAQAQRRYRRA